MLICIWVLKIFFWCVFRLVRQGLHHHQPQSGPHGNKPPSSPHPHLQSRLLQLQQLQQQKQQKQKQQQKQQKQQKQLAQANSKYYENKPFAWFDANKKVSDLFNHFILNLKNLFYNLFPAIITLVL